MKKHIKVVWSMVIFLLFGFLFFTKTHAQASEMGSVEVGFCNNNQKNRELDLVAQAGKSLPICVEFTNSSTNPININIEFLDSVITADAFKDRACNAPDRPKTQFGNFMSPYVGETVLPPWQTIQKEYVIRYPIGFSWMSHGCLAYNIIWWDISNAGMFSVRVRAVRYLDVLVSDGKAIQAIIISQKPHIQKKGNEYVVIMWIKNNWNVDEKIHIDSAIYNALWFKQSFAFDAIIPVDTWMVFTSPSFILPVYGWLFLLSSKIGYTPQLNFNIDNGKPSAQMYTGGTKNLQNISFIWTRTSWVLLFISLLIVISWIRKKQHKKNTQ